MEVQHLAKLLSELTPNSACKYVRSDEVCVFVKIDTSKIRLYTKTPDGNEFEFAPTFIQALAEGIEENKPFNTSQILNNKGSNRAVIDSIIAHTSEFYWLQEGRSRFLVWIPSRPHKPGELVEWSNVISLSKLNKTMTSSNKNLYSLQIIYYGAPGTGKSYCIKEQTKEADADKRVFRTTFHPDSDYSTFVGCYKPSMESKEKLYDKNELISKLSVIKNTGVTYPCHKFAAKYWESLKQLTRDAKKDILSACEFPETMVVEIDKGIVIGEELSHSVDQKQIVYRFVPQAFTNAYVKAYQTTEPVYLVIEEINRGNCAQIFGDLFQLLDRDDNGYSKYPIIADTDLGNHIRERLQSVHIEGIDEAILEGQELVLPSNLYILASMNTSDQSLFPIDSAFKRRWDWKYIPIEDSGKGYTIKVNGHEYDWWTFLEAINKEVFELTNSEDKQMGYFFVKRPDGVIDAETLVSKVYFYLWNDVFKDYDLEGQKAFKKDDNKAISFKEFFAGSKINEALAEQVLLNLGLTYTDHPEL